MAKDNDSTRSASTEQSSRTKLFAAIGIGVLIAVIISANSSSNTAPDDVMARVSAHLITPDETPTIADIDDVDTLKAENDFYKDAQNGDKLIVFSEARRAVIYSPVRDVIVNVGPIVNTQAEVITSPQPQIDESVEASAELAESDASPIPTEEDPLLHQHSDGTIHSHE